MKSKENNDSDSSGFSLKHILSVANTLPTDVIYNQ